MNVVQYLESVDFQKGTGVFFMRKADSIHWTKVNVSISPLLRYRMLHMKDERRLSVKQSYKGYVFESDINSPRYADSPFCLVRFKPDSKTNVPENYLLRCVDEVKILEEQDPILHVKAKYKKTFRRAVNYMRYVEQTVSAKLDDVSVFVKPDIEYIKV